MKKVENIILRIQKVFFSIVLVAMVVILIASVFMRFVMRKPLIWSDEIETMLQGTLAFAGIGYCFHKRSHTELSFVYDRMPRPIQILFDIITDGVMLFCCIYMIRYSWAFTVKKHIPMNTLPWMKQSTIYVFIPIGFVIASCYIIVHLINVIIPIFRKERKGKEN